MLFHILRMGFYLWYTFLEKMVVCGRATGWMGIGLGDCSLHPLYPLLCLFDFCTICITYSKKIKYF